MIVVDTSALMAIVLDEPRAEACMAAIERSRELLMSAGTLVEALIVAERRGVSAEVAELVTGLGFEIVLVTAASARKVADAYGRWGKGVRQGCPSSGAELRRLLRLRRRRRKGLPAAVCRRGFCADRRATGNSRRAPREVARPRDCGASGTTTTARR